MADQNEFEQGAKLTDLELDQWALDSVDPDSRADGQPGPPDEWPYPSWFDAKAKDWWWRSGKGWAPDPCSARPLGLVDNEYVFMTSFGAIRRFTAGQLHGRGGLTDLFVGSLWWPLRHFRKYDLEARALKGALQEKRCIAALVRVCAMKGYYDDRRPARSIGVWRSPEGRPVVHAGNVIYHDGKILNPGAQIGESLFIVGSARKPPAHEPIGVRRYEWAPGDAALGRLVSAHLDSWVWDSPEARDLFQGGLHCDMLCSALFWLPHKFVLAPYGSGKSSLLKYARGVVGDGAHAVQKTYSKAYLEQNFAGTGCAFYLDETESDTEGVRIRRIFELVRLLSDDGAEGGRGSSGGKSRRLDVHGTVTMAATVSEQWQPQDRSRITLLELLPFRDRLEPPAPPERMQAQLAKAVEMSAALRARAIGCFDRFMANLAVARAAILAMGGAPRDADQLGHLVAGWRTMTSDDPFDPEAHEEFTRFRSFIMSLAEQEDGEDAPNEVLNAIFGQVPDTWRSGERMSVGQLIGRGRSDDPDAGQWRRALPLFGMRLEKNEGESWAEAWLWIANKHAGLDRLLKDYPTYQGQKRTQVLRQLHRSQALPGGQSTEWRATKSAGPLRFAGVNSRYLMIPPIFLPADDE